MEVVIDNNKVISAVIARATEASDTTMERDTQKLPHV
jgi:hypothetical protein